MIGIANNARNKLIKLARVSILDGSVILGFIFFTFINQSRIIPLTTLVDAPILLCITSVAALLAFNNISSLFYNLFTIL